MVGTPNTRRKTGRAGILKPHDGGDEQVPALFELPEGLDKSLQEKSIREKARLEAYNVPPPEESDFEESDVDMEGNNADEATANAGAAFNAAAKAPSSKRKSIDTSPKDAQDLKKNRMTSPTTNQDKKPCPAPGKTNIHNTTKAGNTSKDPPQNSAKDEPSTSKNQKPHSTATKENLTMWAHLTKQMPGINVEVAEINGIRGYFIWPADMTVPETKKVPEMTTTTRQEEIPPVNHATVGTGSHSILEGMNNIRVTVPNPVKTVTIPSNSSESLILEDLAKGVVFDAREHGSEDITIDMSTLKLPGQFYTQILKLNPKIKTARDLIIHMSLTNMTLKRLNRNHKLK